MDIWSWKEMVCAAKFIHGAGKSSDFERLYEYYTKVDPTARRVLEGPTDKRRVQRYFNTIQDNVDEKAVKMFLSNGKVSIKPESMKVDGELISHSIFMIG
jgi:hypothetical protein